MITSIQNQKIKRIRTLQQKQKERKKEKVFIAEGEKMMLEVPRDLIEEVYLTEEYISEKGASKFLGVKHEIVTEQVLKHMSAFVTHQGILGIIKQTSLAFSDIMLDDSSVVIIAENLQDPGNIGTLIRTAEAIDASMVVLSKGCVDLYNPKVVRATMGSIFRVPIIHNEDIPSVIEALKAKKFPIYAAHLKGTKYYYELDYQKSVAFLIGNEGNGLTDEIASLATEYIKIPIIGQAESLNASIAAGVLMYEVVRQRMIYK